MLLNESQIRQITELRKPTAQAKKLRELGFVVLGFSARGKVRALAQHPQSANAGESVTLDLSA